MQLFYCNVKPSDKFSCKIHILLEIYCAVHIISLNCSELIFNFLIKLQFQRPHHILKGINLEVYVYFFVSILSVSEQYCSPLYCVYYTRISVYFVLRFAKESFDFFYTHTVKFNRLTPWSFKHLLVRFYHWTYKVINKSGVSLKRFINFL